MYSLYSGILLKIKEKIKELGLVNLITTPEEMIKEKKRFYRTAANKSGKKVFFKTLLAKEKGIKNRFLNEINFSKTLKENKKYPLFNFVSEILEFSDNPSFPYFLKEFSAGNARVKEDKFSLKEIKKIVKILKIINSTPFNVFIFHPKNHLFRFSFYKNQSDIFLKNLNLNKKIKDRIKQFIKNNKWIFYNPKIKTGLTHGDFSEANLLFSKKEIKVIDWEHVHLRNPLYDLADFWLKRRKNSQEQKVLLKEYFKEFKEKRYFFKLFKLALLEIVFRDLNLFQKVGGGMKKEEDDYLFLIENYILKPREEIFSFKEIRRKEN